MTEPYVEHHSLLFGGVDMWTKFGMRVLAISDVLKPELRERKVIVPKRSGAYDYGAKYYDERELTLRILILENTLTRAQEREFSYYFAPKKRIILWNETDKYYLGRAYKPPELKQIRNGGLEYEITFMCEPYAYGETKTEAFTSNSYTPAYKGTAPTPTRIEITNNNQTSATQVQIVQVVKLESEG